MAQDRVQCWALVLAVLNLRALLPKPVTVIMLHIRSMRTITEFMLTCFCCLEFKCTEHQVAGPPPSFIQTHSYTTSLLSNIYPAMNLQLLSVIINSVLHIHHFVEHHIPYQRFFLVKRSCSLLIQAKTSGKQNWYLTFVSVCAWGWSILSTERGLLHAFRKD